MPKNLRDAVQKAIEDALDASNGDILFESDGREYQLGWNGKEGSVLVSDDDSESLHVFRIVVVEQVRAE